MIEFEINGKKRGFRFGTYTFKLIYELAGKDVNIEDVFTKLGNRDGSTLDQFEFLTTFCYACAKHYALSNKQEIDFTEVDVADWIDERGVTTILLDINELTEVWQGSTKKNMRALETGQQPQSSNGQLSPSLS